MTKTLYKKMMVSIIGCLFMVFGGLVTQGRAAPFSSTGIVNPNYNNTWDENTLTGTALFELYIDPAYTDVNVFSVSLEFESDVFDVNEIDVNDFQILNPSTGWSTSIISGSNGYKFEISGDSTQTTPITTVNDPVRIAFNYVLLGADRYNQSAGNNWDWDEGQAWALTYIMIGTDSVGVGPAYSGGSTAPVPEPATILLFGTGLIGFAGLARRKIKKA